MSLTQIWAKKTVFVQALDNQFETQLLESILRDQEISHLMRSYHDTALGGLFQTLKREGSRANFRMEVQK